LAHVLEGHWGDRYTLENRLVLGDPALAPLRPLRAPRLDPARHVAQGDRVVLHGPAQWQFSPHVASQLADWKYTKPLVVPAALGASPRTSWCGRGCDEEIPYYTVSHHTAGPVRGVKIVRTSALVRGKRVEWEVEVAASTVGLEGRYVRTPAENAWHHVTVTKAPGGGYTWTTAGGGVSWRMTPNEQGSLDLGPDCPYYQPPHEQKTCEALSTGLRFGGELFQRLNESGVVEPLSTRSTTSGDWFSGTFQTHKHEDGSSTVMWAVKLLDYDRNTGAVISQLESAEFQLLN
jgi:hypothetical protein